MDELLLPAADDLHTHLRQDARLDLTVPAVRAGGCGRALAMPNLKPPLVTAAAAAAYRDELRRRDGSVDWLATIYLTPQLTPDEVHRCADAGIAAVKFYPHGLTTNAEHGSATLAPFAPVFAAMQERGLLLLIHGEAQSDAARDICVLNAEQHFLPEVVRTHRDFPRLRIVLEHVTTADAVSVVKACGDTVGATITAHHLDITVDDWAGHVHNYCKPVAKYPHDRSALRAVVAAGHPRFFLGSDSAPHAQDAKEAACPCAGVFTQPFLLPYLADTFARHGMLDRLRGFACEHGRAFYGLAAAAGAVRLVRRTQVVPRVLGGVVPYRAGQELAWTISAA